MKTVDDYYTDDVQHILTNVVKALDANSNRKFTQVEVYFFMRWWSVQSHTTRALVHRLVCRGQLSFANGGYTVNDEGTAHYNEIIDQMTFGLKLLNKVFGKCGRPLISWQIDPFGASKQMAALYALMGFDGHVVNRGVDPKGEFIWRGSDDLGQTSHIFTTVLHSHYSAPEGFDFESVFNGNDIWFWNRRRKADLIVKIANEWNREYGNSSHVMMTFGDDFRYKNAEHYYSNIDELIDSVHTYHPNVNIFYSNPKCYLWAINRLNNTFNIRSRDYFPYWSGFFSSRPSLKRLEKTTNNLLQIGKQLDAMASNEESEQWLIEGRNELAVMTHHDAITGTSPQNTINDYIRRLFSASDALNTVINKSYEKLLPNLLANITVPKQVVCDRLNQSECYVSETNRQFVIIIYNPIGRPYSQWIRIPVMFQNSYQVFDAYGVEVSEIYSVPIAQAVLDIPGRSSAAKYELVFKAQLVSLGFVTYFVQTQSNTKQINSNPKSVALNAIREPNITLKGKGFTLNLDSKTGNIVSINLENGKQYPLKQSFKYYKSNYGSSYEFCSEGNVKNISEDSVRLNLIYSSGVIHEVRQHLNEWLSQTIRVYEDEEYIEFDWIVGPIPVDDSYGKDVIIKFETNLNNNKEFYTDGNGRQNIKRIRTSEKKSCGDFSNSISNNYYPIYDKIFIKDEEKGMQLTVLTDRAQGGSSESDGQLELMIHRRQLTSKETWLDEEGPDGRGLVVRGKHYLFFKSVAESVEPFRDLSQRLFMSSLVTFSPLRHFPKEYRKKFKTLYSGLNRDLPQNLHLLTLEKWSKNEILVRFEHFYETEDNNQLSKPTELDLENLFKSFRIKLIREMTLSANQLLEESHRLNWNSNQSQTEFSQSIADKNQFKILLIPQQIRTFILTIEEYNKRVDCSVKWLNKSGTELPANAIIGGFDVNLKPLYICRHKVNEELIIGKANARRGCLVVYGGNAYKSDNQFELLVGEHYNWVAGDGSDVVPERAFVAGKDSKGNQVYIGRCDSLMGWTAGPLLRYSQHKLYYVLANKHHSNCTNPQFITC